MQSACAGFVGGVLLRHHHLLLLSMPVKLSNISLNCLLSGLKLTIFTDAIIVSPTPAEPNPPPMQEATVSYKEIRTLEYREGDPITRHFLTLPEDIKRDQVLLVDLGGRQMSVRVPETVSPGEKVIVVSPSPPDI